MITHRLRFAAGGVLEARLALDVGSAVGEGQGSWRLERAGPSQQQDGRAAAAAEWVVSLRWVGAWEFSAQLALSEDGLALTRTTEQHGRPRLVAAYLIEEGTAARAARRTPAAYLTLPRTNFSTLAAGGTVHGDTVRTDFDRVRLLLPECRVACADFTFASTAGRAFIVGSNGSTRTDYDCSLYGFAQGSCGPAAHACVDLRGTPFAVDATFLPSGCGPSPHSHLPRVSSLLSPAKLPP
jgi:hypothetical protein